MLAKETRWAEGEAEMQCTPRGSEEPLGCSGAGHLHSLVFATVKCQEDFAEDSEWS